MSGVKGYIGEITGTDSKYGFALEFLPTRQISRTLRKATIIKAGQYRVSDGAVVASMRIDTGFIRVDEAGKVTEIKKDEVVL